MLNDPYPWMDEALCREVGTEMFFPEESATRSAIKAKKVCSVCPVIHDCLDYALSFPSLQGIYGGTTERDRYAIKRKRRRSA
jgi:WhiB family redox-sensing transcriptional regulator